MIRRQGMWRDAIARTVDPRLCRQEGV